MRRRWSFIEFVRRALRPTEFEHHLLSELIAIRVNTEATRLNTEYIMSAIDDLKAALNDLATEAVTDLEAVLAKIASLPPDDTAALQDLTTQAKETTAKLKSDMANLTGQPVATPAGTISPE